MEELLNDLKVRCTLSIFRLYPAWRQDDSPTCKAWIDKNCAVYEDKKLLIKAGNQVDLDAGWPDPAEHEPVSPAASMLSELEAVKAKIDETKPPEEIASFFEGKPHGMTAQELLEKHTELTSWIADGGKSLPHATPEQRALHARLTPHVPWLKKRGAVEIV